MKVKCKQCNKTFDKCPSQVKKIKNHFCSKSCAAQYNNKKHPKRKPEHLCKLCQAPITARKRYCSTACKEAYISLNRRSKEFAAVVNRIGVIKWRQRRKLQIVAYLGGSCQICGYHKCTRALECHHRDPATKSFQVASVTKSWKNTKEELKKCILLCSNCHAEVHDGITKLPEQDSNLQAEAED